MQIHDNFLPQCAFDLIRDTLLSTDMDAWRLARILSTNGAYNAQMCMNPMDYNNLHGIMQPFLDKLDVLSWQRIKANLNFRTEEHKCGGFHVDIREGLRIPGYSYTGILYLNKNNGYTEFRDGTKVEPLENRYVEFAADTEHAGFTPTDTDFKAVINVNYVRNQSLWSATRGK